MTIKEIIKNSPLRTFDSAFGGGLKAGELGVLVSRSGTGKTGCVVHIATDLLMRGKGVVHVSFSGNVANAIDWYNEVFKQVCVSSSKLSSDMYDEIYKNRVILSFSNTSGIEKVLKTIEAVIDAQDNEVSTVVFDGFQLTVAEKDDILKIKEFAKKRNVNIWAAVTPVRKDAIVDENGIPNTIEPYLDYIDVLIGLKTDDSAKKVRMTIAKANGKLSKESMKVMLDPQTMLIIEE